MKRYKVTYEYRGKVTVSVLAPDEKSAENAACEEADENIQGQLSVYGVDVEEEAA